MELATYRDFNSSLNRLYRRGGPFQKAAERIQAAMYRASNGDTLLAGLKLTANGESRVPHCVKYDLTSASRLVTVQTDGFCVLVYCGTHEDVDEWLDRNRGFVPVVGPDRVVRSTSVSDGGDTKSRIGGPGSRSLDPLFKRLEEAVFDELVEGLQRSVVRLLEGLEASVTDGELWEYLAPIGDSDHRLAVYDVFALLRQDRATQAEQRALLYLGKVTPLSEVPRTDIPDLVDSDVIKRISPISPGYAEAVSRFMKSARYRDWMLFMHPAQERVVDEDFNGPAKLVGVSGSGKTCVVVRRAVRLAQKYPDGKILVLTLNRALARLISELVEEVADQQVQSRIEVRAFFTLCRRLLKEFEPANDRIHNDITWKSNEHVDDIWQEYYRCENNNNDAKVLQPVHDSLLARGLRPELYLREEVDWLRSALPPTDRKHYRTMERPGRSVPLPSQFRDAVLSGLTGWETKMKDVGVTDGLGMAQALMKHLPRLRPNYRCVLVDEAQDFGNVELTIVQRLVEGDENNLLLCGDAAQAVTTKHQSLRSIGIEVPGARSRVLSLNYRNSRDVLKAAYEVLKENLSEGLIDREDFHILDPEYSTFTGPVPLLLRAQSLSQELGYALGFARSRLADGGGGKACVAVCGYSLYELQMFGRKLGLPVLDGRTPIEAGDLFLSDLEQTKGFEFDIVSVLNCRAGVLPSATAPIDEQHRDLARLYVAMTRAKTDLVLSYSHDCSPFLAKVQTAFLAEEWSAYSEDTPQPIRPPKRLEADRESVLEGQWRGLTGHQFLYQNQAIGLGVELIEKLRLLVDGVGLRRYGERIKWRTLGDAYDDFRGSPRARAIWGPEGSRRFEELTSLLRARAELAAFARKHGKSKAGS